MKLVFVIRLVPIGYTNHFLMEIFSTTCNHPIFYYWLHFPYKNPIIWEDVRVWRILHHNLRSIAVKSKIFCGFYLWWKYVTESILWDCAVEKIPTIGVSFWRLIHLLPDWFPYLRVLPPGSTFFLIKVRSWCLQKFNLEYMYPGGVVYKYTTKN